MQSGKSNSWNETLIDRCKAIFGGCAEILFLRGSLYGGILLAILFLNPRMTLLGVIAVLAAYAAAALIGREKSFLQSGSYIYNPFLVGLSLGYRFQFSGLACLFAFLAGVLTLLLTIPLTRLMVARWKLPVLSLPYSLASSLLYLVTARFTELTPAVSKLPALLTSDLGLPIWLAGFFKAFGSLLYAPGVAVGLLVSLLILYYSRILFLLAVMGYYLGVLVKGLMIGSVASAFLDASSFNYYNFMLVAMALGGTFFVPSLRSTLLAVVGVAVTPFLLDLSAAAGRSAHIPPFTLPFCLIALGAIQILRATNCSLAAGIAGTPEEVREHWLVERRRYPGTWRTLALPFSGRWRVWQGPDGRWTHRGLWRHAFDFVIVDEQGQTHRGDGARLHDYYCYRMPVLSPVRGRVVKVVADVEENLVGRVDSERNWGNLVLLEDPRGFCVELSHFAHRTIRVQEGQWVERGALLGLCGNSGYSAQPHIHVQVQTDARIGAPTLPFSFVSYRHGDIYHANDLPRESDDVEPLVVEPQLDAAATFLPGSVQQFAVLRGGRPAGKVAFHAAIAADGTHYFQSEKGWLSFGKYEGAFYCYHLAGDDPWLRMALMALPRLPLAFKPRLAWNDSIPAGMALTGIPRLLARLGNLVWSRLAYVEISQRFVDRYRVESSLQHPLPGANRKARVELDLHGGLASIQVGDLELKRLPAENDAAAPLASQPRSHKRRRLMSVTAIACLATLAALFGADGTTRSTTSAPAAESPVRAVLARSVEAERSWDYAKGIAALMEQYDAHRGDYALNLRLGWLNYLSGQNDEAQRYYKAAVEAAPKSIEAKVGSLLPLLAAAKYADAETLARQVVAAHPLNYYANLRLAMALRLQNKTGDARAVVKRMLSAYPTDSSYLAESATLGEGQTSIYLTTDAKIMTAFGDSYQAEGRGDYPAAIEALAQQHAANPKDYLLNLRLGWLNYLNRDYAKSAASYEAAVQAAPLSLEAKLGGLLAALSAAKYEAVESKAKALLEQDPGNYYGNGRLAAALRLEKKYDAAETIVQSMLAAYPTDVTWLGERGLLELAQGKKELAKETFADVLALDPQNPAATQGIQGL